MDIQEIEKEFKEKFPMISGKDAGVWAWIKGMLLKNMLDVVYDKLKWNPKIKYQIKNNGPYIELGGYQGYWYLLITPKNGKSLGLFSNRTDKNGNNVWSRRIDAIRQGKELAKQANWEFREEK